MKVRNLLLFVAAAAFALPIFAGQKPGKWQMTMEMEMSGMGMKMPPFTTTSCLTQEQADHPQPPKREGSDCKVSDYKMDGSTVTWKMTCERAKMSGEGKITYSAESYEGTAHMNTPQGEMTMKYTGKRIGECDK